jgi:glutathione synthase/RimK-type ligase-like ATP-grasp enzyme
MLALVSVAAAHPLDEDLVPLSAALSAAGIAHRIVYWDDAFVNWASFRAVLIRSPWDYIDKLPEFLAWAARVAQQTVLLNPLQVIESNTDKHYLDVLAKQGIHTVPSRFIEPEQHAEDGLQAFLDEFAHAEFVVKPAVGAGSKDAQRYGREETEAALMHIHRLQFKNRSVLLQPYLSKVDDAGETALLFFNGVYSHAIRKGPLLKRNEGPTEGLFAPEQIVARAPSDDEHNLARQVVAALPGLFQLDGPLAYARIDLLLDEDGKPCLLELELTEPSLFFNYADGAAERFVAALKSRLSL